MLTHNSQNVIQEVIGSGLFSTSDESYFTWRGCDMCADGLGGDVYDVQGYRNLAEAKADKEGNLYQFQLCGECVNKAYYGEEGQ